jgi:hypothetical protein
MGKCRSLARDIRQREDAVLSVQEIIADPGGTILSGQLEKMIGDRDAGYSQATIEQMMAREKSMFSRMEDYIR